MAKPKPAAPRALSLQTVVPPHGGRPACLSGFAAAAQSAPVLVFGSAPEQPAQVERLDLTTGQPAAIPINAQPGEQIGAVGVDAAGTRVGAVVVQPGVGGRVVVGELTFAGKHAFGFAADGGLWLADGQAITRVDAAGATTGTRATEGFRFTTIRADGVAAADGYGTLRVLTADGTLHAFKLGVGTIDGAALHPTLPLVVARWAEEGALRVVDFSTGAERCVLRAAWLFGLTRFAFSPDGAYVAAFNGGVTVIEVATGAVVFRDLPGDGRACAGAFAADGQLVVGMGGLRRYGAGWVETPGATAEDAPVFAMAANADGVAVSRGQAGACSVEIVGGAERRLDLGAAQGQAVAWSGERLFVLTPAGVQVWADTEMVTCFPVGEDGPLGMALSPDGARVAVADGAALAIIDVATGARTVIAKDKGGFRALDWRVAGLSVQKGEGKILVLQPDGAQVQELKLPGSHGGGADLSSVVGGRLFVAASGGLFSRLVADPKAKIVKVRDGVRVLAASESHVLVSGQGEVALVDLDGVTVATLPLDDVDQASFSPDGARLWVSRHGGLARVDVG